MEIYVNIPWVSRNVLHNPLHFLSNIQTQRSKVLLWIEGNNCVTMWKCRVFQKDREFLNVP